MNRLEGKVAVVTGANSGVGAAIAKLFAAEGATVVMTARREAALEEVSAQIEEAGGKTFVTFLFDSFYVCVFTVPLAYGLHFLGVPIVPLFLACQLADIGKCIIGLIMIKKGTWVHNIVKGTEQ